MKQVYILDARQVVGNCALWWAVNGNGYTTEIEKAGLFDPGRSSRETDIEISQELVEQLKVSHVRLDTLRGNLPPQLARKVNRL